ncbi:MAG: nucleotide pyrophosphohydrolase [Deltaproteobacteria bacterium]|nr:nucleotide pyrophosphohydrolase [Deltaproteobacteria bacterium]
MAQLSDLLDRALRIQGLFAQREIRCIGRQWSRGDLMRGFTADVGALSKLTMAADGVRDVPDYQTKLGHEFADCLWSLLVLSKEYDVDLESEFLALCEKLERQISAEL